MPEETKQPKLFPDELDSREKYEILFSQFRTLRHFWDSENKSPRIAKMRSANGLSSGEIVIVKILLTIWNGNGSSSLIDFSDLGALPSEDRAPFIHWLINPFWP